MIVQFCSALLNLISNSLISLVESQEKIKKLEYDSRKLLNFDYPGKATFNFIVIDCIEVFEKRLLLGN